MTTHASDWWAAGRRVPGPGGFEYFTRVDGVEGAPWITFLHGFPTSSLDWAPVVERLSDRFRLLTFDFLGFGDSDKPGDHRYLMTEQADVVEAIWAHHGVTETVLVAHDYGVSVAQELLARRREGKLEVAVSRVVLLNGGAIPRLHRPVAVQRLLASNITGPQLERLVSERTFNAGLAKIFSVEPSAEELHEHWLAATNRDGHRRSHDLLHYMVERREHARRWEQALASLDVPLKLVWGPEDPVSGAHMLEGLRRLVPTADVVELEGIGHYPQLEAPDEVAAAIAEEGSARDRQ